ncbi:class I SAM-dependent methyltransferase [Paenibacillus sp. 1011MAR3C5]|uniref:class I SAM-dependent methyltransferase n=1 Tax=Paenibacillus sp. 1011MAR3C5 TaxID=1675787 RepID=UPI000E6D1CAD|nr:class I SAM-dependent methyltransferase [Paenibacillus sp. 1011MAR3C5]RJE87043.1 class I SAM-dependent methyltransferase [Paenibacillus sp. 1011MAR3C5]
MNHLFDEALWEKEWKSRGDTMVNTMRKAGVDPAKAFDPKAKTFNEQSFNEEGRKRSARILSWIEGQGFQLKNAAVLDVGAASGVFTVPFLERGAQVTAIESSLPQVELLKENTAAFMENMVEIIPEPFEDIDVQDRGWTKAFDLVFASMCPVIVDWESVEKLLHSAKQFCYISMPVSIPENSLIREMWPVLTGMPFKSKPLEMGYLLHLLYLKGYSYETLITREEKESELTHEAALQEMLKRLPKLGLPADERNQELIADYLKQAYPTGKVAVRQGGRFGKVLIRLQDERMYDRGEA